MNRNDISINLQDAGCSSEVIKEFFYFQKTGQKEQLLKLLAKHKKELLSILHESQKKIDCLDFLIFKLKQNIFI